MSSTFDFSRTFSNFVSNLTSPKNSKDIEIHIDNSSSNNSNNNSSNNSSNNNNNSNNYNTNSNNNSNSNNTNNSNSKSIEITRPPLPLEPKPDHIGLINLEKTKEFFNSIKLLNPLESLNNINTIEDTYTKDYLLLSNNSDLLNGCWLNLKDENVWLFITTLSSLKLKKLYFTIHDHPILRISTTECLFGGKSIISFDPSYISPCISLKEAAEIINDASKDYIGFNKIDFTYKSIINFLNVHYETEKRISKLNNLDGLDKFDAEVAGLYNYEKVNDKKPFFEIDIALTPAELSSLEAPSDATGAICFIFIIKEGVSDFQTGPIKTAFESAQPYLPISKNISICGLKGKILPKANGGKTKSYRFSLFYKDSFALTPLNLPIVDLTVSLFNTNEVKSEGFLPKLDNIAARATVNTKNVDPILLSFFTRLAHPGLPHPSLAKGDAGVVKESFPKKSVTKPEEKGFLDNLISDFVEEREAKKIKLRPPQLVFNDLPGMGLDGGLLRTLSLLKNINFTSNWKEFSNVVQSFAELHQKLTPESVSRPSLSEAKSCMSGTIKKVQNGYDTAREMVNVVGDSIHEFLMNALLGGFSSIPEEAQTNIYPIFDKIVSLFKQYFVSLHSVSVVGTHNFEIKFTSDVPLMITIPDLKDIRKLQEEIKIQEAEALAARQKAGSLDSSARFSSEEFTELINKLDGPYDPEWRRTHKGANVEVWAEDGGLTRVNIIVDGIDAEKAFNLWYNCDARVSWDTYILSLNLLQQYTENTSCSHTVYKTGMGVANREFVEYRQTKKLDNGIAILASSCFHPGAVNSDNVRGETMYSGYIFRNVDASYSLDSKGIPAPASSDAPKRCYMTGLAKQKYGGNLPQSLINRVNSVVIGQWAELFRDTLAGKKN